MGDAHYHDMARLPLYNPRQFVDVHGSLGHGQPGLVTEALSLAIPRKGDINVWLPWLTISLVEPMVRLEETFGSMCLDSVPANGGVPADFQARTALFGRLRSAVWQKPLHSP